MRGRSGFLRFLLPFLRLREGFSHAHFEDDRKLFFT